MSESERTTDRRYLYPLLASLVFFIVLWRLDFPKPMWDDLFYTGAGLNLAHGGDLSNPLLARQEFPSHYFFLYPPIQSYALYAWLAVFGISASSMLAFQNLMYAVITFALILVLKKIKAPHFFLWLAPLAINAVFIKIGLRPEPLGIALVMAGYAWLMYCGKSPVAAGCSFLLIFLGVATAPRVLFFALVLVGMSGWQWVRRQPSPKSAWLKLIALIGVAGIVSVTVFLMLIGFRLLEFISTFHFHMTRLLANGVVGLDHEKLDLFKRFLDDLGTRWWPIFALTIALLPCAWRHRKNESVQLSYFLFLALAAGAFTASLNPGSAWFVILILFLLASVLAVNIWRPLYAVLALALISVLLLANSTTFITAAGQLAEKIHQQLPDNRNEILALSPDKQSLLVDTTVARYVFDYRLPAGTLNFEYGGRFPGYVPMDSPLRENDVYAVGAGCMALLHTKYGISYSLERWDVLGIRNWSQLKYPCRAFIVPARICVEQSATNSSGISTNGSVQLK